MGGGLPKYPQQGFTAEAWLSLVRPALEIAQAVGSAAFRLLLRMLLQDEALQWLSQQPEDFADFPSFSMHFLERWGQLVRYRSH
jgi:hypothetical protein